MRVRLPQRPLVRRVYRGGQPARLPPDPARIPQSIRDLLAEPTWSVRSLLPPDRDPKNQDTDLKSNSFAVAQSPIDEQEITRDKLHHLLRLSALPPPKGPEEEQKLLDSLHRHLHFVRAVQSVDTTKPPTWDNPRANPNDPVGQAVWSSDPNGDIEPLITIRDETFEGIGEATVHLRDLWPTLLKEERRGRNKAVRRRWKVNTDWDEEKAEQVHSAYAAMLEANDVDTESKASIQAEEANVREAHEEKMNWWIDVNRLGGGLESRKKGKYFFVRRSKKDPNQPAEVRAEVKDEVQAKQSKQAHEAESTGS